MSDKRLKAFDVEFFTGKKAALLERIKSGIREPYWFVVTPNVDHLAQLQGNPEFRSAYSKARLRVCDSRILLPLVRSLGVFVEEVIPGSELTMDLLALASEEELRIVLVGATDEECKLLQVRYPGIMVFHHNPAMGFIDRPDEVMRCVEFIRQHPSEFVFYAVGAPRQEILASYIKPNDRFGVGLCVGASISFATGTVQRAPRWMQKIGLEWLHRMLCDPRRLVKRYLFDIVYLVPAYVREIRSFVNNRF